MNTVEAFISKVFRVNLLEKNIHFEVTTDRPKWYKIRKSDRTMFVPGMNVLRINPLELDRFTGAVQSVLEYGFNSTLFNWDMLNLYEYHTPDSIQKGLQFIIDQCCNQRLAVDIETRDVGWDDNKLLAIGFAIDDDTCLAFYNIPNMLYGLLEKALMLPGATYTWHNGKFDTEHLWYTCKIKSRVDEDTMLKHFVQISEKKGTHGLKDLGPVYLQAPQWDDELDAYKKKFCRDNKIKLADFKYDMIPTSILIPYMQRDCIATYRLLDVFDDLKEEGTDWIYRQLCRASNVFRAIECNGATINPDQIEKLRQEYTHDLEEAQKLAQEGIDYFWNPLQYSQETGAKYKAEFSLKSPKQLKWLLSKATGITLASTDAATIDKLIEVAESGTIQFSDKCMKLIEGIKRSRVASKYLDTYVVGLNNVKCRGNKVHATYNLHGTETGRLSSSNPNAQNIPSKNKDVKDIFVAPKGYKLVQLDQSQAELRTLGILSRDPFLIQSYLDDIDLHSNVARKIFGDNFTKEHRRMAKTINFGIPFGRGPGAIAEAFHMPMSEARSLVNDWFKAMPLAEKYVLGQRQAARRGERLQTLFGRVRHFVVNDENLFHVENEYINTPIQSLASDITLIALMDIHDWLVENKLYDPYDPENSAARMVLTVHDSIVLEVLDDEELLRRVIGACKFFMEDVTRRLIENCPLPFKADVEVGYSWGKLEEYDVSKL